MGNSERVDQVFATTCWTDVLSARTDVAPAAGEALARLCAAYWPPLYAFLRRGGCTPEEAEDLVQGFFEQFIAGDYLRDVSRDKGRFRSFLLGCLKHYAANVRRELRTQRRGGSRPHLPLLDPEALELCEAALAANPPDDSVFDRVWAETMMRKSVARVRQEYSAAGKEALFDKLCRWLAAEAKPGDYAREAPALGLTEGAMAAAVFRLRQRFRQFVREEVGNTVQSPADIDGEMQHLLETLTRS
jgi:DNA-directed RNA polymerase specialized sigma24 family protein